MYARLLEEFVAEEGVTTTSMPSGLVLQRKMCRWQPVKNEPNLRFVGPSGNKGKISGVSRDRQVNAEAFGYYNMQRCILFPTLGSDKACLFRLEPPAPAPASQAQSSFP